MMSAAERRKQERRLAELFTCQREANERNDREVADALFREIWAVLAAEPKAGLPFTDAAEGGY